MSKISTFTSTSGWSNHPSSTGTTLKGTALNVELTHEIGDAADDATLTATRVIPASAHPTTINFKSNVVATVAQRLHSPAYMATVRRRKATLIAKQIAELEARALSDDFSVYTLPIVDALRDAIKSIWDAEREGASREVFRNIRDTFLNGGWNTYKDPAAREAAVRLLKDVALAEEVSSELAYQAFDRLADAGLNSLGLVFSDADEEIPS